MELLIYLKARHCLPEFSDNLRAILSIIKSEMSETDRGGALFFIVMDELSNSIHRVLNRRELECILPI